MHTRKLKLGKHKLGKHLFGVVGLLLLLVLLMGRANAAGPYNGTIIGSPSYVTGKFNQALSVSGASAVQGVSLPEPGPADVTSGSTWTIEGWFYFPAAPGDATLLFDQERGSGGSVRVGYILAAGGLLTYTVGIVGAGGINGTFPGGGVTLNAWHHFALVLTGGQLYRFYDGVGSAGTACTLPAATSPAAYLGTNNTLAGTTTGYLDEFSFSTTAQYSGTTYTVPPAAFSAGRSGQSALYHLDGNLLDSNTNGVINMALSALTIVPGQNITETATGVGTSWTLGTTFSVAPPGTITGASISGVSVNVAAQTATFTLTPGTLSGTASAQEIVSNSTDTSTVAVTVAPFTLGQLLLSSTAATAATFTVGAINSGVAPYTYRTYFATTGGFTPGVGNAFGVSGSSPTLSVTGLASNTTYYVKVVASDSAGNVAPTYEAAVTTRMAPLVVVRVGDSLTFSLFATSPAFSSPVILQSLLAQVFPNAAVTVLNEGVSSTRASDWTPTSTTQVSGALGARSIGGTGPTANNLYNMMKADIVTAGVSPTLFCVQLGTNDAASTNNVPLANYYANLQAWLTQAEADYPSAKFIFDAPGYVLAGSYNNNWNEAAISLLFSYQPVATHFADNLKVFTGNTKAWYFFMNNPNQYFLNSGVIDGVHYSNSGYAAQAAEWETSILSALSPISGTKRRLQ